MELIYQLSHEPIRKEDWHSISFMSKCWFMKPMGTHVSGDVNREQAVRYLMDMLELKKIADVNRKQERIVFSGKSIYELFSMQYMFFRYLLKDMSQAECEDYAIDIQELSEMARQLQQSLSHSSEVYICTCDGKVMAFNEFICEVNDGDTYYIGGVYAYHPLLQL